MFVEFGEFVHQFGRAGGSRGSLVRRRRVRRREKRREGVKVDGVCFDVVEIGEERLVGDAVDDDTMDGRGR